jgi:hypothetical protein
VGATVVVGAVVTPAEVATGLKVVSGVVVVVASSLLHAVAARATAINVMSCLEIFTEPECIPVWETTLSSGHYRQLHG